MFKPLASKVFPSGVTKVEVINPNDPNPCATVSRSKSSSKSPSLYEEDYDLLSRALVDEIIEPSRSILIPYFARRVI